MKIKGVIEDLKIKKSEEKTKKKRFYPYSQGLNHLN